MPNPGRRNLTMDELQVFLAEYFKNPSDLVAPLHAVDNMNENTRRFHGMRPETLEKYTLKILNNKVVRAMVTKEFEIMLQDEGIDSAKKKFLQTILAAEKLSKERIDSRTMLDIAKLWGELAGEIGATKIRETSLEIAGKMTEAQLSEAGEQKKLIQERRGKLTERTEE